MPRPVLVVVEDDVATRDMMDQLLADAGYRPVPVPHGTDAHQTIRAVRPELVILDLWLEQPDTGLTILRQLAQDPATQPIPVIVFSAHGTVLQTHREELLAQGYQVVDKPFAVPTMLATIQAALGPEA